MFSGKSAQLFVISHKLNLKTNNFTEMYCAVSSMAVRCVNGLRVRKFNTKVETRLEEPKGREIADYRKYITNKASLREPALTRKLTALVYQRGKSVISLAEGMPNEEMFPFDKIVVTLKDGQKLILEGKELSGALQYLPSKGLPQLLENLKEFQDRTHAALNWDKRDIIVTTGSQDGIYKSMEMLVEIGDPILVPVPSYTGTDAVTKPYNPEILAVPEDECGLIPEKLESILNTRQLRGLKMPKLLYIIPTGANPTGSVIPNSRRREIYNIACHYDLIILEDDPYFFMHYDDERLVSFLSLDTEGRVLRFDSLSKVLSSGLRIGWVTGPKPLINILEMHMEASYLHSATLPQVITNQLLECWGYQGLMDHFNSVRDFYFEKRNHLQAALAKHLTGLAEWTVPKAGMFFWVKVLGVPNVYNLVTTKAFNRGIVFVPGVAFMFDNQTNCEFIRMTFSKASQEQMELAIAVLAELIREEKQSARS